MSSYYRSILIYLFFTINLFANKNDIYILYGLDLENNKHYNKSAVIFQKLYFDTNDTIYLKKAINNFLIAKNYDDLSKLVKGYKKIKDKKLKKQMLLTYIYLLSLKQNYNNALLVAKDLLDEFKDKNSYKIMGEVYFNLKKYNLAAQYFESAYAIDQDKQALLKLTDTFFAYLNQKQKAISYLETYKNQFGCDKEICLKLVVFYEHIKNLNGTISTLEAMYKKFAIYRNSGFKKYIGNLLVDSLIKKDINLAIKFLEKEGFNSEKLMALYAKKGEFKKAYKLIKKKYLKTKDKKLLAQIAILEFEMYEDKTKMLPHVIANFEIALKYTQDTRYLNYYGYILIDLDINIKKGLKLVKKAYKKYPNNYAYADSVAWGYYKLKQCKKAYKYMKTVVDSVGLDNDELKLHWEKIKKCK